MAVFQSENTNIFSYVILAVVVSLTFSYLISSSSVFSDSLFQGSPNDTPVVLVSLESVRSQNIGPCYGYNRTTASSICGVAEDGVLFENAYSQGTATTMAIPPLFTGDLPAAVGKNDIGDPVLEGSETMVDLMKSQGYSTRGYLDTVQGEFIDSSLVKNLDSVNGWKSYNRSSISSQISRDRSSFTWVFGRNTTHKPYRPEMKHRKWDNYTDPGYKGRNVVGTHEELENSSLTYRDLQGLYDAAIATEDQRIGEIFEGLKREGIYEDSLIIITGDHGESFGEHGFIGHGDNPVEEQIRVPLVIKFPDNRYAGSRIEKPVRHMDILPTVQDYFNVSSDSLIEGTSLLPLISGESDDYKREVIAGKYPRRIYTISDDGYKLKLQNPQQACILNKRPFTQLFRLDSENRTDISNENQEKVSQLTERLCEAYSSAYERRIGNLDS